MNIPMRHDADLLVNLYLLDRMTPGQLDHAWHRVASLDPFAPGDAGSRNAALLAAIQLALGDPLDTSAFD